MKIAIDISQIIYGTGVSRYTEHLVRELLKIDTQNEYILFAGSIRGKETVETFLQSLDAQNVEAKITLLSPTLADITWNKFHIMPIEKFVGNIDVFHSSDWAQPPSSAYCVTTVHDLVPFKYPKLTPKKIVNVFQRKMHWVQEEVDSIIVPSEATKKDLVELGFEASKITNIPEGIDIPKSLPTATLISQVKRKYNIPGGYLLMVGTNPRKNIERSVEAFRKASSGSELKLVIIGEPDLLSISEERGIRIVGRVDDKTLYALLTGASALLYPSLYEGFGLPILEAFACETPVVTSNVGSMKDVASDAAVLVDPMNATSIEKGIEKALKNEKELVKKGKARLKDFSWKKMAVETLKIYEKSASSK